MALYLTPGTQTLFQYAIVPSRRDSSIDIGWCGSRQGLPPVGRRRGRRRPRHEAGGDAVRPRCIESSGSTIRDASREFEEQWDWLAARQASPFGHHAWFWAWWNAFGTGGRLSVCAVWRGKRLVAALPLWRRGGVLRAMANVHTPVFEVPACDHQAREAAFAAAMEAAPGVLELEALASKDSVLSTLARDSRQAAAWRWWRRSIPPRSSI